MIFALLLAATLWAADNHKLGKAGQQQASRATMIVGIVDQVGMDYVIGEGKNIEGKMYLRAQGFSPDNFARYVGERVQVEGRIGTDGDRRTFTVTKLGSIKTLPPEEE